MEPRARGRVKQKPRAARRGAERLCYKDCACRSSNPSPTSAKAGAPTSSSGCATAIRGDAGRAPARLFVRRLAQPIGLHARRRRRRASRRRRWRSSTRRVDADRPAAAPGRASAARRRRRRAVRADRGRDDGGVRRAGEGRRRRGRRALRRAGLSLRGGVDESRAQEPRGHPARRVRGARGEDGAAGLGARTSARRRRTRRPARRSSARACRSSPTTST